MTHIYNRKVQTPMRRRLRNEPTKAERILWWRLKGKQVDGLKFRRQYGIEEFVMDFYCPEARLAIEIDGESHGGIAVENYDVARQQIIESFGIHVLRFMNEEVLKSIDVVLDTIWREARERAPLLTKEGVRGRLVSAQIVNNSGQQKIAKNNPPVSPLSKGGDK